MGIEVQNITYIYGSGTNTETVALDNVSLSIEKNEFVGIIGHTGSGKSTLIQHFNGLEKPAKGRVLYDGKDIFEKGYNLKGLRCQVGLVFQYPEYQLFEETVIKEVGFGPLNKGLSADEARTAAANALEIVGVSRSDFEKSPFELSGGQKRRVAIAGILAMEPDIMVLDEPTAGLDPEGKKTMLELFKQLNREKNIGIVLVTHNMEDAAKYANRLIVMNEGRVEFDDTPKKVFEHYERLEEIGLSAPAVTYVLRNLKNRGFDIDTEVIDPEDARDEILRACGIDART